MNHMQDKEITTLLKSLKTDTSLSPDFSDRCWNELSAAFVLEQEAEKETYTAREYLDYFIFSAVKATAKPVMVALTLVLFVMGGSFSAASTSFGSVPGDLMYPVKLTMERAQLAVASSAQQRAKLQVEFAGRRLDELVELSAKDQSDNTNDFALAMEQFKREVQTMQEDLDEENVLDSTELAMAIGRKVEVYNSTVTSVSDFSDQEGSVEEVQGMIEDTKDQAVAVMLSTHETEDAEDISKELAYSFEHERGGVAAQLITMSQDEIDAFTELAGSAPIDYLSLADELVAAGEYRRAFQILSEIETFINTRTEPFVAEEK
jgi:hypothetical protein